MMTPNGRETPHEEPRDPALEEAFERFVRHTRAPLGFHARVMASVEQQRARRRRFAWLNRGWRSWLAPSWVAAWVPALTVGLVVVLTFPLWGGKRSLLHESSPAQQEGVRGLAVVEDTLHNLIQQGLEAERKGHTTEAMAKYREAINQVAFPLNQLAWLLSLQHQTPEEQRELALPLARLAVQLRPEEAEYLDTLAVILCTVGEKAAAMQVMAKAAQLQPQKFGEKWARFRQGACQ